MPLLPLLLLLLLLSFFFFFVFRHIFFRALKNNPNRASATTLRPPPPPSQSSSSSKSNSSCDVFLSFRGEDTRYTFTDYLYRDLKNIGINTFRDDEGLDRGADIAPELLKVIEASKISVVVFSENYADSKWCLEEVAKIMECHKERNQTVIPVFYHVDPSEQVRKQGGSYGKAFALHEKGADQEKMKKIQKWRSALLEASNLSGYHVVKNEYESIHVKEITNFILKSLNPKLMCLDKFIVGMDSHKEELKLLLRIHRIVGICGIGGIGKTTVAKMIYNNIQFEFDGASFLQNVKEEFEKGRQLKLLQQFLRDIMRSDLKLRSISDGMNMIRCRLHSKKVLIVVDDVDDLDQLELLVGSLEWFGPESRIIITTRNRELLSNFREDISLYEIEGLDYQDAFQLFCWHAFQQNDPKENYENLSKCMVEYAQGLPLALEVLGRSLRSKTIIDEWKSTLNKLKNNLHKDIDKVLRISFEGLDKFEKEVFLDIACFFKGEDKDFVSEILDNCDLYGKIGISVLFSKCLITISDDNRIGMHDLIQQMGRSIVCDESPTNPYKESRLWDPNDIHHVFSRKEGIKNIEVISYNLSRIKDIKGNTKVFTKMKKLRLLKVYWSNGCGTLILPKGFEFSSQELRYLYWEAYPLKILPSNFQGENLIELMMPHSNIKRLWSGGKILAKLKRIDLKFSKKLIKMTKLGSMPNLERLNLQGCTGLRELDPSIKDLKKLIVLNLEWCTQLGSLPSGIDELESLEFLFINGCRNLKKFPEIGGNMRRLRELDLRGSGIKDLPSNIQSLTSLKVLLLSPYPTFGKFNHIATRGKLRERHQITRTESLGTIASYENCASLQFRWTLLKECLEGSSGIKEVPSSIEHLTLEVLSLSGYQNLERLPEILGNIGCLRELDVGGSGIKELPSSFKHLTSLQYLNLSYCSSFEKFPEIFGNMRHLRELILNNSGIKELPRSIGGLESLENLDLTDCRNIEILPDSIGNLTSLKYLSVCGCSNLQKLPDNLRSLQCCLMTLNLDGCKLVEGAIPSDLWSLHSLQTLYIGENDIKSVPPGIVQLSKLTDLYMYDCKSLEEITELPSSLKWIRASGCPGPCFETLLSNQSSKLWSLAYLDMSGSDIRSIPAGIVQLSKLKSLYMDDCKLLEEITELPSSLTYLNASGCASLDTSSSKFWSSQIKWFKSVVERGGGNECEIILPGNNGMPEWVRHRNIEDELIMDLPPNWYNDNNLLGFAFFFHSNPSLFHPQNRYYDGVLWETVISGGDQFERVSASGFICINPNPTLLVYYIPRIAISGNRESNKWTKLKAYFSFYGSYREKWGATCTDPIPGAYKETICGMHLIYAEVHQPRNEKHFLEWLRENENITRNA